MCSNTWPCTNSSTVPELHLVAIAVAILLAVVVMYIVPVATTIAGVLLAIILVIQVLSLLLGMALGLFSVKIVHALGFSQLVHLKQATGVRL